MSQNQRTLSVSAAFYSRLRQAARERGIPIAQLVEIALWGSPALPTKQRGRKPKRVVRRRHVPCVPPGVQLGSL